MKRLCFCVFYEMNGIVRDNVIYYLKGLKEVVDKIVFVVNGELSEESRCKVLDLGINIFQRENNGLDFGGWKEALEKFGYGELSNYDELILTNTTCYGPIYPLSEMFNEMEQRDNDFWGITKHPEVNEYLIKGDKNSKIIEHLQTYFMVFNKNVFLSKEFRIWWDNVEQLSDYKKVVSCYEIKLTNYFTNLGFKYSSYVECKYKNNPTFYSFELLKKQRLPLVKKRVLLEDYETVKEHPLTTRSLDIYRFIKNNTNYDEGLIYSDILATLPMQKIKSLFHLNFILPTNYSIDNNNNNCRIASVLYIYYEDQVEICFKYASSLPENSDIYVVSSKASTLNECKKFEYMLKDKKVIYRLKPNRGRDVSAYLVTCADVFENYDLVCCLHDKKSPQTNPIIGQEFFYQCTECLLMNSEYVQKLIEIFVSNPKLGLLMPPPPLFSVFKTCIGNEMSSNMEVLKGLYKVLNLSVPFDKHPCAPFGSMFWVRGSAVKPLFRHKWVYEDFLEEPLPIDGTISHGIERLYPAIVQEAGYLAGWVMPDTFGSIYLETLCSQYRSMTLANSLTPIRNLDVENSCIENLFSIKNTRDKKRKVVTILGVKFKFKRKKR